MTRHVRPGDVSRFAREIVAKRTLILAAVAGIAHVLVLTGALPDSISEQAEAWTVSIIDAVAVVGAIFWVRSGTTPADPQLAPQSTNGRPLVEVPQDGNRPAGVAHVRVARQDLRQQVAEPDDLL